MMLESISKEKGQRKGKYTSESKYTTNSVKEEQFKIEKKDFEFTLEG